MISAGRTELRNSFWNHTDKKPAAMALLKFYSVESGLKAIFLAQRNLLNTDQIPEPILKAEGHNLIHWIKELRLPASVAGPVTLHLKRDGTILPLGRAHEAWRYGVVIQEADQSAIEAFLERVHAWIKENLTP